MTTKLDEIKLVKDDLSNELFDKLSKSKLIAVDCEMMGLNPYRDRLCLVQMCTEDNQVVLVKFETSFNAPNLKKLFENPDIKKIFHFARTDLSFLHYWLKIELKNVFCTKYASRLVRTFTDKHSFKDLTKEFLTINLDKASQSSDWGSDELTKEQIRYAANDVIHLIPIYKRLIPLLEREKRTEISNEVNKFLPTLAKLDLLGYYEQFFVH